MPKIKVNENQTLNLNKVIIRHFQEIDPEHLQQNIDHFLLQVNQSDETYGPIVVYQKGAQLSEWGKVFVNVDVLVQTHGTMGLEAGDEVRDSFVVNQCLKAHFEGPSSEFSYAQLKLDLYCYEHHLNDSGKQINVLLEQREGFVKADLYRLINAL